VANALQAILSLLSFSFSISVMPLMAQASIGILGFV
jgi:hypothetical protein